LVEERPGATRKGLVPMTERETMTMARSSTIMSNTALTGAIYDVDGGQQLVVARPAE
jgi:hypothetical protein